MNRELTTRRFEGPKAARGLGKLGSMCRGITRWLVVGKPHGRNGDRATFDAFKIPAHPLHGGGASTAAVEVLATASAGGGVAATPWVYWCGAEELFLASVEVLFPG